MVNGCDHRTHPEHKTKQKVVRGFEPNSLFSLNSITKKNPCKKKKQKKIQNRNVVTQGAGRVFDLPKKFSMLETRVFGFGTHWGTTFTKVILLRMDKALLYF